MDKIFISPKLNLYFDEKEYQFEDMNTLMFDLCNDELGAETNVKEADAKIREMFFEVMNLNEETVKSKKHLKRAFAQNKFELFEIIEEIVEDQLQQGWEKDPFFMNYVEERNLRRGDRNEFVTEKEAILTVAEVADGNHDIIMQRLGNEERFQVKTSMYAAAVGEHLRRYLTGRIDFQKFIEAITKAFDKKVKDTIYAEVINVGDKLPVSSMFNVSMSLANDTQKEVLDKLIENVSAANGGEGVVIFGLGSTTKKLGNLTKVEWVSDGMKDEMNKNGRLGYYDGVPVVGIPQQLIRKGSNLEGMIDGSHLFVFPAGMDKFIKFVNEGEGEIREDKDGENMLDITNYEYRMSFGVSVVIGKHFGHVKVTG